MEGSLDSEKSESSRNWCPCTSLRGFALDPHFAHRQDCLSSCTERTCADRYEKKNFFVVLIFKKPPVATTNAEAFGEASGRRAGTGASGKTEELLEFAHIMFSS